ncbi:MAG TPA: Hpt domain-containing protein, partial [Acidimicrobiales bacterium]|nr:Hpt domain-containing protein [Acidimicrobiales bacterium]
DTTQEIRRREDGRTHTPVIAMTASAMTADRDRCLAAGMDAYLSKPIDREMLAEVLRNWTADADNGSSDDDRSGDDQPHEDDPIDPALLAQLIDVGGDEFVAELAGLYLGDLDRRVEAIARCIELSGDDLDRLAHDLKGSSANMGLRDLAETCSQIERVGRGDPVADPASLLRDLRREAVRARRRLTQLTGEGEPTA